MSALRDERGAIDWNALRALFPATRRYTYLNTAGAPPLSTYAAREGQRYYQEMLEDGDAPWDRWLAEVEGVRGRLARFLNAAPGEVAFTYSASHGMNLVARMVPPGGRVLAMADEFPASTLPWLNEGFELDFVASGERGAIALDEIRRRIGPDTRAVVTSHVQYATGFRQDLAALGRLCRESAVPLAVDASQSLGGWRIDVRQTGVDFLVFSGYKWPMAGYGVAGLYVAERQLRHRDRWPAASWLSQKEPERLVNDRLDLKETASEVELGCPHFAGIFALGGALELLEELGAAAIEDRIHWLTDYLHLALRERGFTVASPLERAHRAGITIVEMPNARLVVEALAAERVLVSARGRGLRVSLHVFNLPEDVDRFVNVLSAMPMNRAG